MSIHADAHLQFILADYASVDAGGKLNVIGAGISFIGSAGQGQPTVPFTLAVSVGVPAKYANQTYAFSVELHDVTIGRIVQIPAEGGQLQALRAQQAVTVGVTQVPPGMAVPPDVLQIHMMVMQFGNGLPLEPGHSYEWKAHIDGQTRPGWFHRFHVLGAAPGPVFGGPAGSSSIPGVGEYTIDAPQPSSEEDGSSQEGQA